MNTKSAIASAVNLLCGLALVAGATFFMSFLLEEIYPSSLIFLGVPLLIVGGFGLALFSLGIGSMTVRAVSLYLTTRRKTSTISVELIFALLRSVLEVVFGLNVFLLYIYFAK